MTMKCLGYFFTKQLQPLKNLKRDNANTSYSPKHPRSVIETRCKRSAKRQARQCLWFPTPSTLSTTTNHTRCGIQRKKNNRIPLPGTDHRRSTGNLISSHRQWEWSCHPIELYIMQLFLKPRMKYDCFKQASVLIWYIIFCFNCFKLDWTLLFFSSVQHFFWSNLIS